jgi:hypothetical protein
MVSRSMRDLLDLTVVLKPVPYSMGTVSAIRGFRACLLSCQGFMGTVDSCGLLDRADSKVTALTAVHTEHLLQILLHTEHLHKSDPGYRKTPVVPDAPYGAVCSVLDKIDTYGHWYLGTGSLYMWRLVEVPEVATGSNFSQPRCDEVRRFSPKI